MTKLPDCSHYEAFAATPLAGEIGKECARRSAYREGTQKHDVVHQAATWGAGMMFLANQWQQLDYAPYGEVVEVKVGSMTFLAKLLHNHAMNGAGEDCDQWVAEIEGEHPPCWSGGACWENNEEESPSLPPEAWRYRIPQGCAQEGSGS